ncbi:MAG: hypothetical protein ACKOAX_04750, partial [Candidatus Kapaibacterium sp.]
MRYSTRFFGNLVPLLLVIAGAFGSAHAQVSDVLKGSGFIQNNGQWGSGFSYVTKNGNLSTWVTSTGLVFDVRGEAKPTGRMVSAPSKFRSLTNEMVPEMMISHHAFVVR